MMWRGGALGGGVGRVGKMTTGGAGDGKKGLEDIFLERIRRCLICYSGFLLARECTILFYVAVSTSPISLLAQASCSRAA